MVDVGAFDDVEGAKDPERFVAWMDHQRSRMKDSVHAPLHLRRGDRVLDLGCGTGTDLAAASTAAGWAVGVDLSTTMITAAARRSEGRFALVTGDGQRLPFGAGSFDACSCRAVLVHTPAPEQTMAEIRRVLAPGGRVVLSEPDHGSHVVATSEGDVFERVKIHRQGRFRHPLIGRSLAALATGAGLTVTGCWALPILHRSFDDATDSGGPFGLAVDAAVADGAISDDEASRYIASLRSLDEAGSFFFAGLSVVVTAAV